MLGYEKTDENNFKTERGLKRAEKRRKGEVDKSKG
jgi:hypothetical protein